MVDSRPVASRVGPGDLVHTPFGKGTLRGRRNNGRVVVEVRGRAMVLNEAEVTPIEDRQPLRKPGGAKSPKIPEEPKHPRAGHVAPDIDLHGLTVDQALARAETALNDALLEDVAELRFIHGRSGGRIRAALHRWLAAIGTVRTFRVDSRNAGVTIVHL
jgi:dsDNA-specific endonuclease/ATPase MutS2